MVNCVKLNVDASFNVISNWFSIGMILRGHLGNFLHGKVARFPMVNSAFEAEAFAIAEGLSWLFSLPYKDVTIESDSMLSVQAINRCNHNALEVGHVLAMLQARQDVSK
ncbi:hypothetical protein AgCh_039160 [Apium graveolens]